MRCTHRWFVFMTLFAALVSLPNPASAQHEAHQTQAPMAGMDHSKMAPAAPAPIRQISGPAEAAFQAFQDALQVGNRDLASQWLAPDVTVVDDGATDASRESYANRRMRSDMEFLKASKVMLLDREVHDGGDSAQIVSTSRITGRVGEQPVDIVSKEVAQVRKTPEGWQIVRLERSSAPADDSNLPAGAAAAAPMDHSKMATGGTAPAAPGAKPAAAVPMDHSKMAMGGATPGTPSNKPGAKPAVPAPMDHSKMAMSGTTPAAPTATGAKPAAAGAKPAAAAPMDHSKMAMGGAKPGTPSNKPGAKPAAAGTKPTAAAPMDHSKMAMGTGDAKPADSAAMTIGEAKLPVTAAARVMDPACPSADTKTAPKAVHQRRVYYFCSVKDRDAFLKDPAAYLKRQPRR